MKKYILLLISILSICGCSNESEPTPIPDTTFSYELSRELKLYNYIDDSYIDTATVVAVYEYNDANDIVETHIISPLVPGVATEFTANELSTKVRVMYEFNDSYSLAQYGDKEIYHRWLNKVFFLKKNAHLEIYDDISIPYSSQRP